jgi:chemotaxis protein MotD
MMDQAILNPATGQGTAVAAAARAKQGGKADEGAGGNFGDYVSDMARQHGRDDETKANETDGSVDAGEAIPSLPDQVVAEPTANGLPTVDELLARPTGDPAAPADVEALLKDVTTLAPGPLPSADGDEQLVEAIGQEPVQANPEVTIPDVRPQASAEAQTVEPTNLGELIRLLGQRPDRVPEDGQDHGRDDEKHDAEERTATHAEEGGNAGIGMIVRELVHEQATVATRSDNLQNEQRTFSISRADGKGGRLEIVTGADKHLDPDALESGGIDNIVVLDSRRYLGLATESNGLALSRAIHDEIGATALPQSNLLADGLSGNVVTIVHSLKLQMHPGDLGAMTASLRLKGDELSVQVTVETADAYRQLSLDQDQIVKALRDQGFSVDQVTIQLAPAERSADAGNQGNSQGQSFRDGTGQASDGRNGDRPGNEARRQQTAGQDGWRANETVLDIPVVAGTAAGRPGQVYL